MKVFKVLDVFGSLEVATNATAPAVARKRLNLPLKSPEFGKEDANHRHRKNISQGSHQTA